MSPSATRGRQVSLLPVPGLALTTRRPSGGLFDRISGFSPAPWGSRALESASLRARSRGWEFPGLRPLFLPTGPSPAPLFVARVGPTVPPVVSRDEQDLLPRLQEAGRPPRSPRTRRGTRNRPRAAERSRAGTRPRRSAPRPAQRSALLGPASAGPSFPLSHPVPFLCAPLKTSIGTRQYKDRVTPTPYTTREARRFLATFAAPEAGNLVAGYGVLSSINGTGMCNASMARSDGGLRRPPVTPGTEAPKDAKSAVLLIVLALLLVVSGVVIDGIPGPVV